MMRETITLTTVVMHVKMHYFGAKGSLSVNAFDIFQG
jgi:hypothetical protein